MSAPIDNRPALPYCKPCREAMDRGEIWKSPYVRQVKPDACHPCALCGERRYDPVAAGRCAP